MKFNKMRGCAVKEVLTYYVARIVYWKYRTGDIIAQQSINQSNESINQSINFKVEDTPTKFIYFL